LAEIQLRRRKLDVISMWIGLSIPVRPANTLKVLASPRLTVAFFLLMAAAALGAAQYPQYITAIVLTPLLLLLINLSAAILSNARFRADLPLLLFHLALLAFLALLLVARLNYFDGGVKLSTGTLFEGNYLSVERGILHGDGAERLRFANDGMIEQAPPGGGDPITFNQVRWWDSSGRPYLAEIGNDRPLVLNGYRIFSTNFRGFAPIFRWRTKTGEESIGTVHLPETSAGDFPSGDKVTLPGGGQAWVQMRSAENSEAQQQRIDLGAATLKHHLVLRIKDKRYEVQPNASIELTEGQLTYLQLGTWIGYRVTYDPTPPWLAASVFLGVVSLLWFYARLWRMSAQDKGINEEVLS
jgi:hypothetical protein